MPRQFALVFSFCIICQQYMLASLDHCIESYVFLLETFLGGRMAVGKMRMCGFYNV